MHLTMMLTFTRTLIRNGYCFPPGKQFRPFSSSMDKTSIARVRQTTGVAISKCFAALKKFNQNEDEAIAWLEKEADKEGWAKAQKLKDRVASQGAVGMLIDSNVCAVVKVNCETDFVARNEQFHELTGQVCKAALQLRRNAELSNDKLNSFQHDNTPTHFKEEILINRLLDSKGIPNRTENVETVITEATAKLGENIRVAKAITMVTPATNVVEGYVHGNMCIDLGSGCRIGQLGAVVTVRNKGQGQCDSIKSIAQRIAQHIVGLNTENIGNENDAVQSNANSLLNQPFLFDNNSTVGEILDKHNAEIIDFIRLS